MNGVLGFKNYKISCIIGVEKEERSKEQGLFVDLRVTTDMSKCVSSDQLEDTIDYVALADLCSKQAQESSYRLIERLAADIIENIFEKYPAKEVFIMIKKPDAIDMADYTLVEMTKKRE